MSTNQGCVRYVISTQIAANVNVFTSLFIKDIVFESSINAIVYNLMGNRLETSKPESFEGGSALG